MLAGPRSWMYAPFSAPPAPKNKLGPVQTPTPSQFYRKSIALASRRRRVVVVVVVVVDQAIDARARSTSVPG
jgi:hypothetical protein